MSATSSRARAPGDTDDVTATARAHATIPAYSTLQQIVATDGRAPGTLARLTLGLIMFPHAAQKAFGWFGGGGFSATYESFTTNLGIPGWLAGAAIIVELVSAVLLILGAFTRFAAGGIIAMMVGAIVFVHAPNGFFMNWSGQKAGEGFEFHLLAIGLALVTLMLGGGAASVDRALMRRRSMEGGSVPSPVTRD